jgi:hypothetical protein
MRALSAWRSAPDAGGSAMGPGAARPPGSPTAIDGAAPPVPARSCIGSPPHPAAREMPTALKLVTASKAEPCTDRPRRPRAGSGFPRKRRRSMVPSRTDAKARSASGSSTATLELQEQPLLPPPVSRSDGTASVVTTSITPSGCEASIGAPPSGAASVPAPASFELQVLDASNGDASATPASRSIGPVIPRSDHARRSTLAKTIALPGVLLSE